MIGEQLPSEVDEEQRLHLFLSVTPRLPRDGFGRRASPSGRALLTAAARQVAAQAGQPGPDGQQGPEGQDGSSGQDLPIGPPTRTPEGRWHWPDSGWRGSVSHTGQSGMAVLARGVWVGADIQDERARPAALRWLARVLGTPPGQLVTIRDWAEVEALLKARGDAGIRPTSLPGMPGWHPGWRQSADGWWLRSEPLAGGGGYLALAAGAPLTVCRMPEVPVPAAASMGTRTIPAGTEAVPCG